MYTQIHTGSRRLKFISKILKPLKSRSSYDTAASEGDATVFKTTFEESVKDVNVVVSHNVHYFISLFDVRIQLSPPAIGGRDEGGMPVAGEDEVDVVS